jgi:hypothetical protein
MKISEIEILLKQTLHIRSQLHFDRYIKFVEGFVQLNLSKPKSSCGEFETHHILPKKIFPEYTASRWNKTIMPSKAHYLAHYLLFKAIAHPSLVYSFNQMRRVSKKDGKVNCRLYAAVRLEFAELIKQTNTGKVRSEKFRKDVSERSIGKNNYRNETTQEVKKFPVGQQPDGWTPFQKGRKRTNESKNKMTELMTGRIWQYNELTQEVRFEKSLLTGFLQGYPDWYNSSKDYLKSLSWAYNPDTGEAVRVNKESSLPNGFILGRSYNNVGLTIVNNSNVARVVDLQEQKFCMVSSDILPHPRYIKTGSSLDNVCLFEYNNMVYTSYKDLIEMNPELPDLGVRNTELSSRLVSKPHFNMTDLKKEFCTKNQGRTMDEIGVKVFKLSQFEYQEDRIYVRRK